MSDLRPCPNLWCKRNDVTVHGPDMESDTYCVGCECGIGGPECATESEAVAAWNHRPAEDALKANGAIRPGSDTNSPIVETASCKSCGKQTAYRCPWDHVYICGEIACREKHEEVGECRRVSP